MKKNQIRLIGERFWNTYVTRMGAAAVAAANQRPEPDFVAPISSLTIAAGRDATLQCEVEHLGQYRVAWIHVDRQTLLTIDTHVITRNERVQVRHQNYRTWQLEIRDVRLEDGGYYMCQLNTQPMKNQVGYLDVNK
ncbi:hypothetical protein LAZ67_9003857 [Cordylochernes scorpioides]|uniref:Ig-like domain-containing protein n=1 Tax=Cordylochernes scorpioides TaxID=51811 RepID=A0ABY6KY26_9ARAC|nr:hypothetical protein LAZ67_9003857 [Cordylochernes scorpioides]